MSELVILGSAAAIADAAAELFVECTAGAAAARERAYVALTGGSSASALYEALKLDRWIGRVPWPKLDLYVGDERAVALSDSRSNAGAAERALGPLMLSVNRHFFQGDAPDLEAEARRCAGTLPPRFDLVLLGLGSDGHVLSLFAGVPSSAERGDAQRVRAVAAPVALDPKVPRLTMTPAVLLHARTLVVMTAGAGKRDALWSMLRGPEDLVGCPAQWLRGATGRVVVLADEAAADRLKGPG